MRDQVYCKTSNKCHCPQRRATVLASYCLRAIILHGEQTGTQAFTSSEQYVRDQQLLASNYCPYIGCWLSWPSYDYCCWNCV